MTMLTDAGRPVVRLRDALRVCSVLLGLTSTSGFGLALLCAVAALIPGTWANAQPCFGEIPISFETAGARSLSPADLDGDGDIDIAIDATETDDRLFWFENLGGDLGFAMRELSDLAAPTAKIDVADIDGDGHTDIAVVYEGTVLWFRNDGAPDPVFTESIIATDAVAIGAVRTGDIDADGDVDILIGTNPTDTPNDAIIWYENDGEGVPGFTAHLVSTAVNDVWAVEIADLDNDGLPDLASASSADNTIAWYRNNGGGGADFTRFVVSSRAFRARDVKAADVNGDGFLDLVSTSLLLDEVNWHENDGEPMPTFTERRITSDADGAFAVDASDLDGDGDLDIVTASAFDDTVAWYENDGALAAQFTEHVLTTQRESVVNVKAVDLDQDGFTDILAASVVTGVMSVYRQLGVVNANTGVRYERLGPAIEAAGPGDTLLSDALMLETDCHDTLDFMGKPIELLADGPFERPRGSTTVMADQASLATTGAGDAAVSGTLEVPDGATARIEAGTVTLSGPVSVGLFGTLLTAQDTILTGSPIGYTERLITDNANEAEAAVVGDLDGDGFPDVVSASSFDNRIRWHRSDGASPPTFGTQELATNARGVHSIAVVDVQGDGPLDVFAAQRGNDTVAWYENPGMEPFQFTRRIIDEDAAGATSVVAADVDSDDAVDAVVALETAVVWYESDGMPSPGFTKRVIDGARDDVRAVDAADIDSDGDIDVVAASRGDSTLLWYEHNGSPDPAFTPRVITTDMDGVTAVVVADINRDGAMDIVAASRFDDMIAVHLSNGASPPSFTLTVVSTEFLDPRSVFAADVDGDNDLDIVTTSSFDSRVAWHANNGGIDPTFTSNVVTSDARAARSAVAADLDLDGDQDLLVASEGDDTVRWFETELVTNAELSGGAVLAAAGELAVRNRSFGIGPGSLVVGGGTVSIDRTSELAGAGAVLAPLTASAGLMRPDPGAAIALWGDYAQEFDDGLVGRDLGEFRAHVGPGSVSRVDVLGRVTLAGSLTVSADDGFDPPVGSVFTVMTSGVPVGEERFDVAFLPPLGSGKFFRVVYDFGLTESPGGAPAEGVGTGTGSVSLLVETIGEDIGFGGPDELAVSGLPVAAELADLNADGLDDLAIAVPAATDPQSNPGSVIVLLNLGDKNGVWQGWSGATEIAVGVDPSDLGIGDVDGVGGPDIAVSNRSDGTVSVLLNDGAGVLAPFAEYGFNTSPEAVEVGDLDGDGLADVAVAGSDPLGDGRLTVRLNASDGQDEWEGLGEPSNYILGDGPTFMQIGDLDNDSDFDFFAGSTGEQGIGLLQNLGGGPGNDWLGFDSPLQFPTGPFPAAGQIGDLDNDSCFDVFAIDGVDGTLSLFEHGGPGGFVFSPPTGFPTGPRPRSIAVADLDGDEDQDLALITETSEDDPTPIVRIFRNDFDPAVGQLQFTPDDPIVTPGEPLLVRTGDVDGIGSPDLVVITRGAGELPGPGGVSGRGTAPIGVVSTSLNLDTDGGGCNAADLAEPFGLLDLVDITTFIGAFTSGDFTVDFDGNGLLDLADVLTFITEFGAGCP